MATTATTSPAIHLLRLPDRRRSAGSGAGAAGPSGGRTGVAGANGGKTEEVGESGGRTVGTVGGPCGIGGGTVCGGSGMEGTGFGPTDRAAGLPQVVQN